MAPLEEERRRRESKERECGGNLANQRCLSNVH